MKKKIFITAFAVILILASIISCAPSTAEAISPVQKEEEKAMFSIVESGDLSYSKYYVLVDNDTNVMYLSMQADGNYRTQGITTTIMLCNEDGSPKLYGG